MFDNKDYSLSDFGDKSYSGSIGDAVAMFDELFGGRKYDDIIFIVPFNETFVKTLTVNKVEKKYLKQIIENEYEDVLQLTNDNFIWDFHIVDESDDKMSLIVSGVKRKYFEKWVPQLMLSGYEPTKITVEQISLLNTHYNFNGYSPVVFVDIGRKNSNIIIYDKSRDYFQMDIPVGGNDMLRNIKDIYGIENDEALDILEGRKEPGGSPGRFKVIVPVLDQIIYEVKRALIFYENRYKGAVFSELILTGGVSNMPDVSWYMGYELGINVKKYNYLNLIRNSFPPEVSTEFAASFNTYSVMLGGLFD